MKPMFDRFFQNLRFCMIVFVQAILIVGPIVSAIMLHWWLIGMLPVTVAVILTMHGLPKNDRKDE